MRPALGRILQAQTLRGKANMSRTITRLKFAAAAALIAMLIIAAASCGGGTTDPVVTIVSINTNPGTVTGGNIVELSAAISAPGQTVSSMTKTWSVDAGTLFDSPPDFSASVRGVSQSGTQELATTASRVYWLAPGSSGAAVIGLAVEDQSKTKQVNVGSSPLNVAVTDGAGGSKVVTVSADNASNMLRAAFRVSYSSAWTPDTVEQGDFLGPDDETLFLSLTNQNGFVPVAVTRKGNSGAKSGDGVLATITFNPSGSSSASSLPFDIGQIIVQ